MQSWLKILFFVLISGYAIIGIGQNNAIIKEYQREILTYPFSDPNPIPDFEKCYPFFRYDGFTDKPILKEWKIVELENDFIRVEIFPEIGGKVWSAYDKINERPFIYENDVVKFRDIAMRGAWTSGGLEMNFGIIGHTPSVATPVDYIIEENSDGSVSCHISHLDLMTRTYWTVEIRLPKDKAFFETNVNWYNSTDIEQPYYHWMNLAVKAQSDLTFIDPGTHYIGHDGRSHSWPLSEAKDRDYSKYKENDFGGSKSFHILGKTTNYFGTLYGDGAYGMIHVAERDDKIGKKVFLWALSEAGQIWEDLLTDNAGQYVEIQSGRLFNQNGFSSSSTPFKQLGFQPMQSDSWTEKWYPFQGLEAISYADERMVIDVNTSGNMIILKGMGVEFIQDTITFFDKEGNVLYAENINVEPLEIFEIGMKADQGIGRVVIGSTVFEPLDDQIIDRPVRIADGFDEESSYGQYLLGRDAARFRQYSKAENHLRNSFELDSFFIPTRVELAKLEYRKMNYQRAYDNARFALSIDTYHPEANYYYALAADKLGKENDARDGWQVASLSESFRKESWFQLAKYYYKSKQWEKARTYNLKCLSEGDTYLRAWELQHLLNAKLNLKNEEVERRILGIDPLNHFLRFEKFYISGEERDLSAFQSLIRSELPAETYLELAIHYYNILEIERAQKVLEYAPKHNLIEFWKAHLAYGQTDYDELISLAEKGSPELVFPFRVESASMLEQINGVTKNWKPRYYLGVLQASKGNHIAAREIFLSIKDDTGYSPFYQLRSSYQPSFEGALADMEKAYELDNDSWRVINEIIKIYKNQQQFEKALHVAEEYYKKHPSDYKIGMKTIELLMILGELERAETYLQKIHILPYEGAFEGRRLYRAVHLLKSLKYLNEEAYEMAGNAIELSRLWPKRLGVGKPFPEIINNNWEGKIALWIQDKINGKSVPLRAVEGLKEEILSRFMVANVRITPY